MPIIKSAIKRVRQSAKRRSHNLQVKRLIHSDIRAVHAAISTGDAHATATTLRDAQSELDRAVKKGVLHKNTAGRRKAQLAKRANLIISGAKTESKTAVKPKAKSTAKAKTKKSPVKKKS